MPIIKPSTPVGDEIARALELIERGEGTARLLESEHLDLKEEAGSRDKTGARRTISPRDDDVAKQLAAEAACFANTPGGGALIVGVSDDGVPVGAQTDASWLRHRIYQLTQGSVTPSVSEYVVNDHRVLVVEIMESVELVRWRGKCYWRVGTNCEVIDPTAWLQRRRLASNYDWSSLDSGLPATAARPVAVHIVREWLQDRGDERSLDLLACNDADLLRRLGAVTGEGNLTHAGRLLFVGRDTPAVDYMRREYQGGDSLARVNLPGVSLAEELQRVFTTIEAYSPRQHVKQGLVAGQVHDIPLAASREAVVNGVAHRDWSLAAATVIEHVGSRCEVTSPGGFHGTVTEHNVLTHPSHSRNRDLTLLLAKVGVAEQEGVGVDRMTAGMIRHGHEPPIIKELDGPFVRTVLMGGAPNDAWIGWLSSISPNVVARDVGSLLMVRHLTTAGWIDATTASGLIQHDGDTCAAMLETLARASCDGEPLIAAVAGTPQTSPPAWALTTTAARALASRYADGAGRAFPSLESIAESYAASRGRISSTELASIVGKKPPNVSAALKRLVAEGILRGSSPAGRGQGFHYLYNGT